MTNVPSKSGFGARISAYRRQQGLSQGQLAHWLRMDPSRISRIENGRVQPTIFTAKRIANALHVSLNDLTETSKSQKTEKPCPVSPSGQCMIDLLSAESELSLEKRQALATPQKIRILKKFLEVMLQSSAESLNVYEHFLSQVLSDIKTRFRT